MYIVGSEMTDRLILYMHAGMNYFFLKIISTDNLDLHKGYHRTLQLQAFHLFYVTF